MWMRFIFRFPCWFFCSYWTWLRNNEWCLCIGQCFGRCSGAWNSWSCDGKWTIDIFRCIVTHHIMFYPASCDLGCNIFPCVGQQEVHVLGFCIDNSYWSLSNGKQLGSNKKLSTHEKGIKSNTFLLYLQTLLNSHNVYFASIIPEYILLLICASVAFYVSGGKITKEILNRGSPAVVSVPVPDAQ